MNSGLISFLSEYPFFKNFILNANQSLGFDTTVLITFIVYFTMAFILVNMMMIVGGLGTYAERKISADLQARIGPNRVGPYGILQFLADGLKMLSKEDIAPKDADKFLFYLAPFLCMVGVSATLAVLPISSGLTLSHLNVGIFYLVAISSLVGLGIFLGGYASNSKWSLLGGMRGAAQIISYEIPVTLSILAIVILAGGLSFETVVSAQSGGISSWYIFHNPFTFIGAFVFFVGALAETNRAPFDLPEAESELVSGYHTEYTGMRFGFFALAEYAEVFVVCGVAVSLFLGGYNVPYDLGGHGLLGQLLQVGSFVTKTVVLYYIVIWIRWTFPRLRVDQLMVICWKYLTPIAIFNIVGCAFWVYFFDDQSMLDLVFGGSSGHEGGH